MEKINLLVENFNTLFYISCRSSSEWGDTHSIRKGQ